MARQYLIPGFEFVAEVGTIEYLIPGLNEAGETTIPPGTSLTPAKRSLTITGRAPTLNAVTTPPHATLHYTPFTPAILVTTITTLTPARKPLTFTRYTPGILVTTISTVTPAHAALHFTCFAPAATYIIVSTIPHAALHITGGTITITGSLTIPCAVGATTRQKGTSLEIIGYAPFGGTSVGVASLHLRTTRPIPNVLNTIGSVTTSVELLGSVEIGVEP